MTPGARDGNWSHFAAEILIVSLKNRNLEKRHVVNIKDEYSNIYDKVSNQKFSSIHNRKFIVGF